ncbi:hypothetical protein NPL7_01005 [Metamycoplasma hyosynoviae]|uniref:Uncharacterized protein n=1 Tax=Metamycoplasma hyosynoviae TaxID=29559 RepID=A0A063YIK3_9BACT|nr:hypothetical protein [Metamycoplasma hyosynoviae]ASI53668.1 hypothetical protein MHSN_00320 [Metamycoplasma hyosynoviae]KDE42367.1 hypothetical protein NPL7_01005 [Metamycoplasma hyosynoviae]KDE43672.1 hypothetical protein NPL1_00210 [Metamycoplasma hyosynoviae]KDE44950.1 hypothetical protein NPL4_02800 [Metamycoplasma hyosynoviae]MDD1371493.1 hypothetical protein [Metamycoplasma hyosynoviae]
MSTCFPESPPPWTINTYIDKKNKARSTPAKNIVALWVTFGKSLLKDNEIIIKLNIAATKPNSNTATKIQTTFSPCLIFVVCKF